MDRKTAIHQALSRGSQLATGYERDGYKYGGSLYAAAADQLNHPHFCESCKEDDLGCAARTIKRMGGSIQSALGFLENVGRMNKEAVTSKYQEMMGIISPIQKHLGDSWPDTQFKKDLKNDFNKLSKLHHEASIELKRLSVSE